MSRLTFAMVLAFAVASVDAAQTVVMKVVADHENVVYTAGETAMLKFSAFDTNGVAIVNGKLQIVVDNFGNRQVETREVDLARENPFIVKTSKATPGFMRVTVKSSLPDFEMRNNDGKAGAAYVYGVAFSPEGIRPGTPNPDDFDEFWANAIRKLDETVPVDAQMELMPEKSTATLNYYKVSFATYGNRRVYGWLCEPKDLTKGPYPVRVSVPGAGYGALSVDREEGAVSMLLNVHSYPQPDTEEERKAAYRRQEEKYAAPNCVMRYCEAGIHRSREDYFYYASVLGINRAFNWLAKRPECDLKRFSYSGTSQGGGFGLMLTALNPHITSSCIFVPAITDLLGFKQEDRQSGWPRLIENQLPKNRAAAEKWAPYFCGVNFARRIKCPIRFVVGFSDCTCSPNAVYSAYNVCPSADKGILHGIGMGHGVFGFIRVELMKWRNGLLPAAK